MGGPGLGTQVRKHRGQEERGGEERQGLSLAPQSWGPAEKEVNGLQVKRFVGLSSDSSRAPSPTAPQCLQIPRRRSVKAAVGESDAGRWFPAMDSDLPYAML